MTKTFMLVSFFIFTFQLSAFSANYYVDTATGDNANAGSFSAPWKEMAKAEATASNNDTVYVKSGTYVEPTTAGGATGNLNVAKAIAWIAVTGWDGSGNVTTGGSVILQAKSGTSNLTVSGATVKSFTGFTVNSTSTYGVLTSGAVGATTFTNCVFQGATGQNVYAYNGSTGLFTFTNCTFNHATGTALYVHATSGSSVVLTNPTFAATGAGHTISAGNGAITITGGTATRTVAGYFINASTANAGITIDGLTFSNYVPNTTAVIYINAAIPFSATNLNVTQTNAGAVFLYATTSDTAAVSITNSSFNVGTYNGPTLQLFNDDNVTITGCMFVTAQTGTGAAVMSLNPGSLKTSGVETYINNNTITSTGAGSSGPVVYVQNRYDTFQFKNNTVTSTNASNARYLFRVVNAKAPEITGNTLSSQGTGAQAHIDVNATSAITPSIATISNNTMYSHSVSNYIINFGAEATSAGDDAYAGSVIERNRFYGPGFYNETPTSLHGLLCGFQKKVHLRFNYFYGSYYGFVVKSDNADWQHTAGVYGNIVINSYYMSIYNKGCVNLDIFNNTLVVDSTHTLEYGHLNDASNGAYNATGTKLFGNLLIANATDRMIYAGASTSGFQALANVQWNWQDSASTQKYYYLTGEVTGFDNWVTTASDAGSLWSNPFREGQMYASYNAILHADQDIDKIYGRAGAFVHGKGLQRGSGLRR